jgi:hypothetical protein
MLRVFLSLLVLAGLAATAFAHGFSLSLMGNSLVATSNDFPGNGNPHLFLAELSAGLTSTHGGAGSTLFGTGKSLSFDVFGPLWYSSGDGNPAQLAATGISLLMESASLTGSIAVDRDSTFTAGYAITGNTSHEFLWTLQAGFPVPEGLYGLAYRVKGSPTGGDPYDPTPLLVPTFMTPNFEPGDPMNPESPVSLARAAIYAAAVPEPSSLVLAAVAAIGATIAGRRVTTRHGG